MSTIKSYVIAGAIAALLLVPTQASVARADEDDWEDYWEDYWDDREDALEEAREEAEERWEDERDDLKKLRRRGVLIPAPGWRYHPYYGAYRSYHPPRTWHHRFHDSYCPHRLGYYHERPYRGWVHAGPVWVSYGPSGAVQVGPIHVYWD